MSRSRETLVLTARFALLALVAGGLAAAAFAGPGGQDPDGERHVIRLEKKIACAGEDCPEAGAAHRMIFVGEDGEVHELSGDAAQWTEGAHHHLHALAGGRAGYLGVVLAPMTPELRAHEGAPEEAGVLVSKVIDDSPAARAGIRVGDVISAVDGEAVATPHDLAHAIRGREDGATVNVELWRDGAVQTLTAAVEEREGLGLGSGHRRFEIRCEGGDCEGINGEFEPYDCGGAEQCEVKVLCGGDGCDCTVNGEAVDCITIPGPHNHE
jgi:membrane-associated protease RseP (regulator of RpoE activity)